MFGHCPVPSRRKDFAQEIGKHMHVDLFTNVALPDISEEPQCPVNAEKNMSRDYKFYFSFENTVFTTEKIFKVYLYDLESIPVVNGSGPVNAADYLPKGTFVNAMEFPSASCLKLDLTKNSTHSSSKEKTYYYDAGNGVVFSDAICQLCNK